MTSEVKVIQSNVFTIISRTNRLLYIYVVGWSEIRVTHFKNLIDLLDLQNDLGGQSCKSQIFLQ